MLLNLVPYPVSVRERRGRFDLSDASASVDKVSLRLVCIRHKLKSLEIPAQGASPGAHTVVIGSPELSGLRVPRRAEGYALRCDRGGVVVRGSDADGLFWGLTTLEQLINGGLSVPCVEIRDYPAFGLRYHHDDISRKQVSKLSDFKRIIRLLSYYKIRYYTPYMEDMLFLKSHPDIGEGRGRLTPGEVRAMLAEARRYNVTVFPTYSLIGHQENLLSNPKYRTYAREVFQLPSSFDPSKPALRPFLRKVIRDVCEAFPDAPFFHAGFDETQGLRERELIAHANWCAGEIARHGKQMLMWVDMFKNHYGLKKLKRLSDTIIPVEWNYADPAAFEAQYREAGICPTGLAGYRNWCKFLPDFDAGKKNMRSWAALMRRWGGPGFGVSMWGDNGYENARDMCWNLFAYNGEVAWRGRSGPADFERRFQSSFYGVALPPLERIVRDLPRRRRADSGTAWRRFRVTMPGMVRQLAADPALAEAYRADLKLFKGALRSLDACRERARRESEHLDHFEVALLREINVCERMLLAGRVARGLSGGQLKAAVARSIAELRFVKRRYRTVWLRHNKRPNIEVSLAVYDRVESSLKDLCRAAPRRDSRFLEADMAPLCNAFFDAVSELPLTRVFVHGVPFRFAPLDQTHCALAPGDRVSVPLDGCKRLSDIHLIYGGQTLAHRDYTNLFEVALLREGRVVFRERLKNIKDICCWWAPMGEHMWAGGGYAHVNQSRNRLAIRPGPFYGLMHLNGFALGGGTEADTLQLSCIGKETVAVFAATAQLAE